MPAMNLKDLFNCDEDPLSEIFYGGKHVGFFAVVDDLQNGYDLASTIPAPQCKGSDVFTREALPEFVVFTYPEHSLVVTQQQQFVDRLVKGFPMTKRVVIITTSALIMTDALNSRILRRRKILDEQDEE